MTDEEYEKNEDRDGKLKNLKSIQNQTRFSREMKADIVGSEQNYGVIKKWRNSRIFHYVLLLSFMLEGKS